MNEADAGEGESTALPGPFLTDDLVGFRRVEDSANEQFEDFYRRFVLKLVGFLMWQGASAAVAADLAQEVMIKAFRRWQEIDRPEPWAFRVASRDLIRHLTRVEEEPFEQLPERGGSLVPRHDALAEWESRLELERLLEGLPQRQRQVLAWSVAGYGPTEIAQELAMDPRAVRSSLLKARRSVAARMRPQREGL